MGWIMAQMQYTKKLDLVSNNFPPSNMTNPSRTNLIPNDTNQKLPEIMDNRIKGLYKKARSGKLKNFTGIDSNYEIPSSPEIILETKIKSAEELADEVILYLKQYNKI